MAMRLRVQFFSQLREIVGAGEIALDVPDGNDGRGFARTALPRLSRELEKWDRSLLVGAGVEFVGRDYVIQPNDEIAIMPPVQGG